MRTMVMLDTGISKEFIAPDRTRICNPQIRSLVPYPLGHRSSLVEEYGLHRQYQNHFNQGCNFCMGFKVCTFLEHTKS